MKDLLFDERICIKYLMESGVFINSKIFLGCGNKTKPDSNQNIVCYGKNYWKVESSEKIRYFEGNKLEYSKIIMLTYLWIN